MHALAALVLAAALVAAVAVRGGATASASCAGPATPPEPDRPVSLRSLKGVPTRIAVAGAAGTRTAYLAPGFPLELRSHPRRRLEIRGCRSTNGTVIAAVRVRGLPPVR